MKYRKIVLSISILLLLSMAGFVASNSAWFSSPDRMGDVDIAAILERARQNQPAEVPVDRVRGIPDEQRTHRLPANKKGVTSERLLSGNVEDMYNIPLNIDVEHVTAAAAPLEDGDLVMGVVLEGEARAYPVNYMMGPYNEAVNDTLGGTAIAATW